MQAMREEIEKNGSGQITRDALWRGFNSFYDIDPLVKIYQSHYSGSKQAPHNKKPIADRYFENKLGIAPGIAGNYLAGRGFSPKLDRYGQKRGSRKSRGDERLHVTQNHTAFCHIMKNDVVLIGANAILDKGGKKPL